MLNYVVCYIVILKVKCVCLIVYLVSLDWFNYKIMILGLFRRC